MLIDIIYGLLVIIAIFKGLRRGLILAVFSLLSFIIGLAAALKLSVLVAGYLGESTNISARWLPVISFILVFIIVALGVRWVARLLEAASEAAALGMLNRLGGVLLYCCLYTFSYSVLLFYAVQIRIFDPATLASSISYSFIAPWGPKVIEKVGELIPVFSNLFTELSAFFEKFTGVSK
jgi:membrane protein required for colicin V production